jgi:AcrR family transcriptional regulator
MTPRPYRMGARQAAAEDTRERIVAAARELLAADERAALGALTIDNVARQAGVARMTIYYQFGSKTGLIEAVFDSLAIVRRGVERLVAALQLADPAETLAEFVRTLADVWEEDRLVIRRLHGHASLDAEFAAVWDAREGRRRDGMRQIAARASAARGARRALDVDAATAALYALVSPEGFEAMAGRDRSYAEVAPLVHQLARKALGLDGGEPLRWDDAAAAAPARTRR